MYNTIKAEPPDEFLKSLITIPPQPAPIEPP